MHGHSVIQMVNVVFSFHEKKNYSSFLASTPEIKKTFLRLYLILLLLSVHCNVSYATKLMFFFLHIKSVCKGQSQIEAVWSNKNDSSARISMQETAVDGEKERWRRRRRNNKRETKLVNGFKGNLANNN